MNSYPMIKILPRRDIPVLAGHPWIFSNGVEAPSQNIPNGSLVNISNADDKPIGIGFYNGESAIRVRMLSLNRNDTIDPNFLKARLIDLKEAKLRRLPDQTTGFRWVYAESDNLPGLIIDQFGDTTVFQIHTAGMERLKDMLIKILKDIGGANLIERSDVGIRKEEGLSTFPIFVHQGHSNEALFLENNLSFSADVMKGQKTGFFLDQREARMLIAGQSNEKEVLNLFSYTGAFSVAAAAGGAKQVTSVDISQEALNRAQHHFTLNNLNPSKHAFIATDAFKFIDKSAKKTYDLIICDPPAFAKTAAQTKVATEAYIRINKKCLEHLPIGGLLLTSSCSGRISATDFEKILRTAATQANKQIRIVKRLGQSSCHTQRLAFPEGQYLKTLFVEILPWG